MSKVQKLRDRRIGNLMLKYFRKNFGPKGYGFGGGAGTLSMDDGAGYKSNPNAVDHKAMAYVAPKKPLVPSNSSTNIQGKMNASS